MSISAQLTQKKIEQDFADYFDSYHLLHDKPGRITGNSARYTSEYLLAMLRAGPENKFSESFALSLGALKDLEIQPGLIKRHPKSFQKSQQGPDDYVAVIALSSKLGREYPFASRFLQHWEFEPATEFDEINENKKRLKKAKLIYNILSIWGTRPIKGVFNNNRPGTFTLSSFLGRQLQLKLHAYISAKHWSWRDDLVFILFLFNLVALAAAVVLSVKLWIGITIAVLTFASLLYNVPTIAWIVSIISSGLSKKKRQDNWVLGWYLVIAADNQTFVLQPIINWWKKKIRKVAPGGIGEILGDYFPKPNGVRHPSSRWLNCEYGDLN